MKNQFIKIAVLALVSLGAISGCGENPEGTTQAQTQPAVSNNTISNSTLQVNAKPQNSSSQQQPVTNQSGENEQTNTTNATTQNSDVPNTANEVNPISVDTHSVPEIFGVPQGEVALTIDDGPSPYTEQIISVLNEYHAKATFFFTGNNALQFPDAIRMAAASGDEIGDHTVDHPQLTKLSLKMQQEEIDNAAKDISLYDPSPIVLFRPPYELMNRNTLTILAENHMALALWNRDPRDWAAKTPKQIVKAVLDDSPSGGVFDLHDKLLTLEALPDILKGLEAMHLRVVVLPEPVQ